MIDTPLRTATPEGLPTSGFSVHFAGADKDLLHDWADEVTGGNIAQLLQLIAERALLDRKLGVLR